MPKIDKNEPQIMKIHRLIKRMLKHFHDTAGRFIGRGRHHVEYTKTITMQKIMIGDVEIEEIVQRGNEIMSAIKYGNGWEGMNSIDKHTVIATVTAMWDVGIIDLTPPEFGIDASKCKATHEIRDEDDGAQ